MSYIEGFVVPVPAANREAYHKHAADGAPIFKELGVRRHVECWGDEVPDGKVTDLRRSVKAEPGEVVVFAWFEHPSKAAFQITNQKMRSDSRMNAMAAAPMPFDAKRMIYGTFEVIVDEGAPGRMGYTDGFVLAVPTRNREAYRSLAAMAAGVYEEYGATRVVEAWGDHVPVGTFTDFRRAVQAKDDESIVFSWIEWPSKDARATGNAKVMADPRMKPELDKTPFDPHRMIWGGFVPILDA